MYTCKVEHYQNKMNWLYREEKEFYYDIEQSGSPLGWNTPFWREVQHAILDSSRSQLEQLE